MSDANTAGPAVLWAHIHDGVVPSLPVSWAAGIDPNEDPGGTWVRVPNGETVTPGMTWDGKAFGPAPEPSAEDVATSKARLVREVDVLAEALRLKLLTSGSGQAMEYQEAYAQARQALADPTDATADLYPMLAATIGLDKDPDTGKPAADVLGVARAVKRAYEGYVKIGAAIKRARTKGKAAVDAASTIEAAQAAFAAIAWPARG